jgi:chromosome segregation ATPase
MDVSDFVDQLWLQVIGAAAGAILTIAIGAGALLFDRWRREVNELNSLLSFMSKKRSLSRPSSLKRQLRPRTQDANRCIRSVLSIRDEAQAARRNIRSRSSQIDALDELIRVCNQYVDALQKDPRNYRKLLAELQHFLDDVAMELARNSRSVSYLSPGGSAL